MNFKDLGISNDIENILKKSGIIVLMMKKALLIITSIISMTIIIPL